MSNQYVVESGRPPSYLRTAHAQKMKKVEFAMPCHAKLDMARTSVGAVVEPARVSRVARAVAEAGVPARLDAAALIVCMYSQRLQNAHSIPATWNRCGDCKFACWDSVDDGDSLVSAEPAWIQLQAASVVTRWINATATQDQVASCLLPRGSLMQQKASGTGGASLAAWIMMGANSGRINTGDIKGPRRFRGICSPRGWEPYKQDA